MTNPVYKEQTLDVSRSFGYGLIYKPTLIQQTQFSPNFQDTLRRRPHPMRRFR